MQKACRRPKSTWRFPQSPQENCRGGHGGRERLDLAWSAQTGGGTIFSARWDHSPVVLVLTCAPPKTVSATSLPGDRPLHSEQARWHCPRPVSRPPSPALPSLPHPIGNLQLFCKQPDLWCQEVAMPPFTLARLAFQITHHPSQCVVAPRHQQQMPCFFFCWDLQAIAMNLHNVPGFNLHYSVHTYLPGSSVIDNPLMPVGTCKTSVMSSTSYVQDQLPCYTMSSPDSFHSLGLD